MFYKNSLANGTLNNLTRQILDASGAVETAIRHRLGEAEIYRRFERLEHLRQTRKEVFHACWQMRQQELV